MIKGLSHVSIVVPSLDIAAKRLLEIFGLTIGEIRTNEEQGVRLAYVDLGNAQIELIEPSGEDSPSQSSSNAIRGAASITSASGLTALSRAPWHSLPPRARLLGTVTPQFNAHGERIAFVHPSDFLGVLVELEEQSQQE